MTSNAAIAAALAAAEDDQSTLGSAVFRLGRRLIDTGAVCLGLRFANELANEDDEDVLADLGVLADATVLTVKTSWVEMDAAHIEPLSYTDAAGTVHLLAEGSPLWERLYDYLSDCDQGWTSDLINLLPESEVRSVWQLSLTVPDPDPTDSDPIDDPDPDVAARVAALFPATVVDVYGGPVAMVTGDVDVSTLADDIDLAYGWDVRASHPDDVIWMHVHVWINEGGNVNDDEPLMLLADAADIEPMWDRNSHLASWGKWGHIADHDLAGPFAGHLPAAATPRTPLTALAEQYAETTGNLLTEVTFAIDEHANGNHVERAPYIVGYAVDGGPSVQHEANLDLLNDIRRDIAGLDTHVLAAADDATTYVHAFPADGGATTRPAPSALALPRASDRKAAATIIAGLLDISRRRAYTLLDHNLPANDKAIAAYPGGRDQLIKTTTAALNG